MIFSLYLDSTIVRRLTKSGGQARLRLADEEHTSSCSSVL